ncbi:TonB-dependent receptor domain-containing protein [Shewanella maritima]|uniref:TonB-dependent receptor domain-containing protein n=1 Tax=Shewanella maritima TaxID=2520507 RepID=UPI003736EA6D
MSSRQFSLSVVATAIVLSGYSPFAAAAIDSTVEAGANSVDLNVTAEQFHYRTSEMPVAQAGMIALPASAGSVNTVVNRGAVNGVALQQDGIFLAPAPYSSNVQVQPNLLMMTGLNVASMTEVSLGGQGSFGALNYQSVKISPKDMETVINAETSQDGDITGGFITSGQSKQYGMLLAVDYQKASKDVGFSKGFDAEYSNTDVLFKIAADSLAGARKPQRTEFSFQYINNDNDISPVGITPADFNAKPATRYFSSSQDNEQSKRYRYVVAHEVKLSSQANMLTDFYYQSQEQRINQMQYLDDMLLTPTGLSTIAQFEQAPVAQGLMLGSMAQSNDLEGFGIQTRGETLHGAHKVIYTARYHHDKAEMRLGYQDWMYGQDLSLTAGELSPVIEYKDDATALTTAVDTQLNYDNLYMNIGLGYENVDVSREVGANFSGLDAADFTNDGWLPSLELGYRQSSWSVALSAKQAWTAASAGNAEQKPQEALQYEVSGRYQGERLGVASSVYYHDFDNQHMSCSWAIPCNYQGKTVQDNISDVAVMGADLSLSYHMNFDSFSIPFTAQYLYAKAEIEEEGCNFFACYGKDVQLPWVPEHQATINTGLIIGSFSLMFNALYQSELGYKVSDQVENYSIDGQWKLDVAANYAFSQQHNIYVRVENALDEALISQHTPLGINGQSELTTLIGYQGRF